MRLLLISAALLSLSFCSVRGFECPRNEDQTCIEDRFPHPDCTKYFRCFSEDQDCVFYIFDCPVDLHFSPTRRECVDPEDAGCTDSTTSPATTQFTTSSSLTPISSTESTTTPILTTTTQDSTVSSSTATPTTFTSTTTSPPSPDGVNAFSVSRSSDWYGGDSDVYFDEVDVNLGDCFKTSTTFQPGRYGVNFFSFSGGVPSQTPADIKLRLNNFPNSPSSIYRESTTPEDSVMMYRNALLEMVPSDSLTFQSLNGLKSRSSQASFSGFSLTDMFADVQAFYTTRDDSFDEQGRIQMSHIDLNIGNNYDLVNREFIAPQAGVYYFFFGCGQEAGIDNRIALRTWEGVHPQTEAELWVHSTSHNGLDMSTRGTMIELNAGQRIYVSLMEKAIYSDAEHRQIYFGGFLYNPKQGPSVAFAVHRGKPWQSAIPLDPVPFEYIGVNQGNIFNALSNTVHIAIRGYYYLEVSLGTLPFLPLDVEIMVNGEPGNPGHIGETLAHIIVASSNHSHVASTGRSLITHLEQNDVLRLRAKADTGIFSDMDKQTTWMGFLLYED